MCEEEQTLPRPIATGDLITYLARLRGIRPNHMFGSGHRVTISDLDGTHIASFECGDSSLATRFSEILLNLAVNSIMETLRVRQLLLKQELTRIEEYIGPQGPREV